MRKAWLGTAVLVAILSLSPRIEFAQTPPPNKPLFQIVTKGLPVPASGQRYFVPLKVIGGQPPYHWSIQGKDLPAGLTLDVQRGVIFGRPATNRQFSVVVQVADSSQAPLVISKLLVAAVPVPLTVSWTNVPQVAQSNIVGSVRVSNGSTDDMDMTVIVTAVNEIGKAFALNYARVNLPAGGDTPDLKFDVFMPNGQYTVHADAVGEVAAKNAIYRDRREQDGLVVQ